MTESLTARMPAAEVDVVLRDGSTVHVRPVTPDDRAAIRSFLERLSGDSRRLRYFSAAASLDLAAEAAVDVDPSRSYGLVATRGDGRVVAHAGYSSDEHGARAEVAFAVADELHGMGIATTLLAHLAEAAEANGIAIFDAEVLPENHQMIEVFRESGFEVRTRSLPGVIEVELPTALSPEARERFEARQRVAASAAVRSFLEPQSVAVIGASRRPGTVGNQVVRNLAATGFNGPIYPVNPHAGEVESLAAYPSVEEIAGPVELAVIAVPAAGVADVARACARKGVRALLVLSAGFAEVGEEGAARQAELVRICRDAGMRLVGPNCIGLLNTAPQVSLNATFAPSFPPRGNVGFLSQSGALGITIIDRARALGLGLSSFISNGNKADISGNDLLEFWESDPGTDVIVLYLESFGNPRRFAHLARRVGRTKPILAVKSGRSAAGSRATSSHTGALVSASDITVGALFRQAGVIRTDTLSELFDVAKLVATQPIPRGPRVGIVTNGGGLGILCADACEDAGLEVVELPKGVRRELASFLPEAAATGNPVDMIATATAGDYRRTVEIVAASGSVDAVISIFIPPLATRTEDVAHAVREAAAAVADVPVLTVFASADPPAEALVEGSLRLPSYTYPEEAARALGLAAAHGAWRERPAGVVPAYEGLRVDETAGVIAAALGRGADWLSPAEVQQVLSGYGFTVPAWRVAATAADAAAAAAEIGRPVALKAIAPGLVHKTDAGAVALGLRDPDAVRDAARRMGESVAAHGAAPDAYLVQAMAAPGVEMLVGVVHDPLFGPVVACGAGGTMAELLGDVTVRPTPVTDLDAREMVASLRMQPLLEGYRGSPPVAGGALEDLITRLGVLVERHPEIAEADLNPVIVSPSGACVVDARIRVEPAPPPRPWPAVGV